jgi:acetyl esterase/lipase
MAARVAPRMRAAAQARRARRVRSANGAIKIAGTSSRRVTNDEFSLRSRGAVRMTRLPGVALGMLALALISAMTGCSSVSFFVANAPASFGSWKRSNDLPYGSDPRQRLDVFSPPNARNLPIVVFFYGGSWTAGRKSHYAFVGAALASRGFVTVIPDYRLFPQVRFPLFEEDGASAVAWVQQHAREIGGDPDRIVLMGHSAGAHTAALLALNPAYLERAGAKPSGIVGLIGLSGPYALVPDTDELRTIFASPYTAADWQPVRFASAQSPPTLLLHGLADTVVSVQHTEALREALLAHGASVETHLYPHRGHADTIASFALVARFRTPALAQTVEFLQRVTQHRPAAASPAAAR